MSLVPEFWQKKYRAESAKSWNLFYKRNEARFFKDRHWIAREFPELFTPEAKTVLEVGCGVGNFALPLLEENEHIEQLYGCDFAPLAVDLLKADERYAKGRCTAFVADLSVPNDLCKVTGPQNIDVVTSIFVLSALPPEKFDIAIENIIQILKPGGLWLFRDYAVNDAAQLRFKDDRKLADTLFVRQDGTLSYFFEREKFIALAEKHGLEIIQCDYHLSRTTNAKKELDVERRFLQAKLRLKQA